MFRLCQLGVVKNASWSREPHGMLAVQAGRPAVWLIPPTTRQSPVCVSRLALRDKSAEPSNDGRLRDNRRLRDVGETLRTSWQTPTDTMITDDLPTLLTLLSKVPSRRKRP